MKMRLLLVLSVVLSLAAANKPKSKAPKAKGAKAAKPPPKITRATKDTTIASLMGKKPKKKAILFRVSGTQDSLVDDYFEALNGEKNIGMDFVWADENSATLRYQIGGSKGKKYGVNEFPKLVVVDPKGAKYANVHMDLDKLNVDDIKKAKFDKKVEPPLKTFAHKQVYMFGGIGAVLGGIIGFLVGKKAGGGAAAGGKAGKGKILVAGKKFDKKVNKKGHFEKGKGKKWKKVAKGEKEAVDKKTKKIKKGYRWVGPAPKAKAGKAKTGKASAKKGAKKGGSSKKGGKAKKGSSKKGGKAKKGSKKKASKGKKKKKK